jgi:hypothetical protein
VAVAQVAVVLAAAVVLADICVLFLVNHLVVAVQRSRRFHLLLLQIIP